VKEGRGESSLELHKLSQQRGGAHLLGGALKAFEEKLPEKSLEKYSRGSRFGGNTLQYQRQRLHVNLRTLPSVLRVHSTEGCTGEKKLQVWTWTSTGVQTNNGLCCSVLSTEN
jgi:hypothetical protein